MSVENRSTHDPGSDFPSLRSFLRGYLHQDAAAEYGSARAAAIAFRNDADAPQVDELRAEWKRFLSLHPTLESVNKGVQTLGASWNFETLQEVQEILAALGD